MGTPVEILESELLQLPQTDRIRLLDRVIASLDADAAREAAWDALAARREADSALDPTQVVPLEGVLEGLRNELQ